MYQKEVKNNFSSFIEVLERTIDKGQNFKDLGYPTTMKQAVTEIGDLVWQKDEDGRIKPQMKRERYGGADWVETHKAVLQDMMLKEFGWESFY